MRISVLNSGSTYIGDGDFYSLEEWSKYLDFIFKGIGDSEIKEIPRIKAHAICRDAIRTESCFEHGPGYIFPDMTPEEVEEKVRELFPELP